MLSKRQADIKPTTKPRKPRIVLEEAEAVILDRICIADAIIKTALAVREEAKVQLIALLKRRALQIQQEE
jgi:hypothetical protein